MFMVISMVFVCRCLLFSLAQSTSMQSEHCEEENILCSGEA